MQFDLLDRCVFGILEIGLNAVGPIFGWPRTVASPDGFHIAVVFPAAGIRTTETNVDYAAFACCRDLIRQYGVQ